MYDRSLLSSTVGHLGPASFDPLDDIATSVSTSSAILMPHTLQLPADNQAKSQTPSSAGGWHMSPSIMDKGTNDESDSTHFTLKKSIEPSKFNHLFHIKLKLNVTNYVIHMDWCYTICTPNCLTPCLPKCQLWHAKRQHHPVSWQKVNLFVCSVLIAVRTQEQQHEISHLSTAVEIWVEAHKLYIGTTSTD